MSEDAKRDWVERVLGVSLVGASKARPLLPIWIDAKDAADEAISALQKELVNDGHPDLLEIAEFGLNGITDGQSVGMMVALRMYDAARTEKTRAKAAKASADFRSFLDGEATIDLIEDNPFGVSAPVRSTFGRALDLIDRQLNA